MISRHKLQNTTANHFFAQVLEIGLYSSAFIIQFSWLVSLTIDVDKSLAPAHQNSTRNPQATTPPGMIALCNASSPHRVMDRDGNHGFAGARYWLASRYDNSEHHYSYSSLWIESHSAQPIGSYLTVGVVFSAVLFHSIHKRTSNSLQDLLIGLLLSSLLLSIHLSLVAFAVIMTGMLFRPPYPFWEMLDSPTLQVLIPNKIYACSNLGITRLSHCYVY
jgi:hypothetical protein